MDILALNQPYLGQSGFRDVLTASGHRTFTVDWYEGECDLIAPKPVVTLKELYSLLPPGFDPARIVYFDRSEPVRVLGLAESPVPTIVHLVDTHIHKNWHPFLMGSFDVGLLAMKGYLPLVPPGPYMPPVEWFPLWAFKVGPVPESPRDIPVSFRGSFAATHPKRKDFFEAVNARTPVDYGSGPFFDLYANSKIILNDCINDDLNWRVFEALASGALLLTPRVSAETLELFPDGDALVTYRAHDVNDAVDKIGYYLSHDEERVRIARNGYSRLVQQHTATDRAKQLVRAIESARPRPVHQKLLSCLAAYLKILTFFPLFCRDSYRYAACEGINRLHVDNPLPPQELQEQRKMLCELLQQADQSYEIALSRLIASR